MSETRISFAEPLNRIMGSLLLIFTIVFILQMTVAPFNEFALDYLALDTNHFLGKLYLWQICTCIFLHAHTCHFLMNMIFLWYFGTSLANAWSRRDFITYLCVCGLGSSLCFYGFHVLFAEPTKALGAPGVVFGVMAAYAMVFGNRIIIAFFVAPMKAKYFIIICFAIEVLALWQRANDGVGHMAHISGAVLGACYLKWTWKRQDRQAGKGSGGKKQLRSRLQGLEL